MTRTIRAAILGASGYTGAELIRLLSRHPRVQIVAATADRSAGKPIETVFPHLIGVDLPLLQKFEEIEWPAADIDVVFCALPHGATQTVIKSLFEMPHPRPVKVVDLSADFRLESLSDYAVWYGHDHAAPVLQQEAVYGLTELNRADIAEARLVANPGCYPTSAILPLAPLLAAKLIDAGDIIIDAKSGVSGAGRAAKEGSLYSEVTEGVHAYGIGSHRHAPEIEQELSKAAGQGIIVNFTPHLLPMSRGMLSTIHVRLTPGKTADDLRAALTGRYAAEEFVVVLPEGASPASRHVRGSNYVHIGVFADRVPGRAIIVSVIDNLVKGASGQAVQNMNVMFDLPENLGLEQKPLFP